MKVLDNIISDALNKLLQRGVISEDVYNIVLQYWDSIKSKINNLPILSQVIVLHSIISLYHDRNYVTLGNYIVLLYETLTKGNDDFFTIVGILGRAMTRAQKYGTILITPYCVVPKKYQKYLQ